MPTISKKTLVSLGTALTIIGGGGYKLGSTDTQIATLVQGNDRIVARLDTIADRLAKLTGQFSREMRDRNPDVEETVYRFTGPTARSLWAESTAACFLRPHAPSARSLSSPVDLPGTGRFRHSKHSY